MLAAAALADSATDAPLVTPEVHPEDRLSEALAAMRDGQFAVATQRLERLLSIEPNFRLARLLYGEALALRSGAGIDAPLASADPRIAELLAEYRQRNDQLRALPAPGMIPDLLLKLSEDVGNVLVVDLGKGRAYLIDNHAAGPYVVRNLYAGIGRNGFGKRNAGDLRTPVGVYRITDWMADEQLPPLYGSGALPLNYPNSWDRSLGRTGSGIWLHGVPGDTYVRGPRSSEGCVTFSNNDLLSLRSQARIGVTPVILAEQFEWVPAAQLDEQRRQLLNAIEGWRSSGAAPGTAGSRDYYADDVEAGGPDRAAFSQGQPGAIVELSDLSLFAYPGESGLVLAQFIRNVAGSDPAAGLRWDQYWRRQSDGAWKIVREMRR